MYCSRDSHFQLVVDQVEEGKDEESDDESGVHEEFGDVGSAGVGLVPQGVLHSQDIVEHDLLHKR